MTSISTTESANKTNSFLHTTTYLTSTRLISWSCVLIQLFILIIHTYNTIKYLSSESKLELVAELKLSQRIISNLDIP